MKIKILQEFEGYPDGTAKSLTVYKPGEVDVPGDYADLLIKKGLAEEVGPEPVKPAVGAGIVKQV